MIATALRVPSLHAICRAMLIALVILATPGLASAQTDQSNNDLRRENDQLKERIAGLEAQVEQLRKRVQSLDEENRRLRQAITEQGRQTTSTPGGSQPTTPTTTTPKDPLASPDSLFNTLLSSFQASPLASMPYESRTERTAYTREATRWARGTEREYRGPVTWTIEITEVSPVRGRDTDVTFFVLNAQTGERIGDAVTSAFPARFAQELRPDSRMRIEGVFGSRPNVNPERLERGTFDNPRFIAPMIEFGFDLAVRRIEAAPASGNP